MQRYNRQNFDKHTPLASPLEFEAYEAGIKRGVWELTEFNSYGTPVVPIRKSPLPGQAKASIRVCRDYSVTVNSQLEDHRQPIPLPEDPNAQARTWLLL